MFERILNELKKLKSLEIKIMNINKLRSEFKDKGFFKISNFLIRK